MTNKEDVSRFFEIHENEEGRFLVEKKSQKRIVSLGNETIQYLEMKVPSIYHSFKVIGKNGAGLMQLKYGGKVSHCTTITGEKKSENGILELDEVMTVPAIFKDVLINHISERFGVNFPLALKSNGDYVVFYNGEELTNTLGYKVLVCMRESGAMYIPQIISYRKNHEYVTSAENEIIFSALYNKYPKLNFIKNADFIADIVPSFATYKTDIWMYSAKNKIGIVYINSENQIKDYTIPDINFSNANDVYFINEHYIIYDVQGEKRLYFNGKYIGCISRFSSDTKQEYFVKTDKGFYIGKTFFDAKNFYNLNGLKQDHYRKVNESSVKIYLRTETAHYNFLLDLKTGIATKCY